MLMSEIKDFLPGTHSAFPFLITHLDPRMHDTTAHVILGRLQTATPFWLTQFLPGGQRKRSHGSLTIKYKYGGKLIEVRTSDED